MPKKYTDSFKEKAVFFLKKLIEAKGKKIIVEGVEVKNVRELVQVLEISSYTLYQWQKKFNGLVPAIDTLEDLKQVGQYGKKPEEKPIETYIEESKQEKPKVKFGGRFWGFVGRNMGIKNYEKLSLKQLKKAIIEVLESEI